MGRIPSSEITPEHLYLSRRQFMQRFGLLAGSLALAGCSVVPAPLTSEGPASGPTVASEKPTPPTNPSGQTPALPGPTSGATQPAKAGTDVDELGAKLTSYEGITGFSNYYEFSTAKDDPAVLAKNFKVAPWTITIGGLVNKPATYAIEDLLRKYPQEERIYRLRCVEAWSMVIPWLGFPLSRLLTEVEPLSKAKYVRFETLLDPNQMPGQHSPSYHWPYVEGLRIDEAMHNLTILATGLYGKSLLPQNGAPLRIVAPWKYGFKSIKSIVKIDLVEEQPTSFWMAAAPDEYGFYANVNPAVDHPRWSQASERRIGELKQRMTLPFNGYADQVASLYTGMDLKANF